MSTTCQATRADERVALNPLFGPLRKSITRSITLFTALFATVISIVSFVVIGQGMSESFKTSARLAITQRVDHATLSIQAAQNAAVQIVGHETVIDALSTDRVNPVVGPLLNTLKNTSFGIAGLTLYTPSQTYTTSNIAAVPTLDAMRLHPDIGAFLQSDRDTHLSLRTSHIAELINHVRYDPEYGMLTYIVSLPRGYLFMDLNPRFIQQTFFDFGQVPTLSKTRTYLVTADGKFLKSDSGSGDTNAYLQQARPNTTTVSHDREFLLISVPFVASGSQVISVVPLAPLRQRMVTFAAMLLLCSALAVGVSYLVANQVSERITTPLTRLRTKMLHWNA